MPKNTTVLIPKFLKYVYRWISLTQLHELILNIFFFQDACKLQKIMHSRAKELVSNTDRGSDSDESDNEESCSGMSLKRSAGMRKRALANELKRARRSSLEVEPQLKKRFQTLYKTLIDYVDDDDRYPVSLFMEKPSRADYPDYYEFIENPIDMKTIESNIKNDYVSHNFVF